MLVTELKNAVEHWSRKNEKNRTKKRLNCSCTDQMYPFHSVANIYPFHV